MPQVVVNMKVSVQNKISCNLETNRFNMQYALYSNRYALLKKREYYEN